MGDVIDLYPEESPMDFSSALFLIKENIKVARLDWPAGWYVLKASERMLKITTQSGAYSIRGTIDVADVLADDWVCVDEVMVGGGGE